MSDEKRMGVFVCECGDKIAGLLDVPALARQAGALPGVIWAGQAGYGCLPNGLEHMRAVIAEQRLDRVVIAGCAPRTHEGYFRQALDGKVNPALVNVTNLRDVCARPHRDDPAEAMTKARDQIAMAVADLAARQPATLRTARITPHAVVIGGGIAGMTAALAISGAGVPVTLVEREPDLGGLAHRQPDDRETADLIAGSIAAVRARSNITVLTNMRITDVAGPVGCYQVTLSDGQLIEAGAIVVATGGQPGTLPFSLHTLPSAPRYALAIDGEIVTRDELTGQAVCVLCDETLYAAPMEPSEDTARLAEMLRLPPDAAGFLADVRVRLRPPDHIERGVYVCGAAHYPCDAKRATFEAYSAAARAVRHIQQGQIANWSAAATIDVTRCNGCGDCVRVCPFMAVTLGRQGDQEIRLAIIDPLVCTGCGNCVSVCPVKAAQVETATDEQIEAQIRAALDIKGQGDKETRRQEEEKVFSSPCLPISLSPPHLVFACEWSGYSAAEVAGAQGLRYPANTRVIRLNCTGRLQPGLILKALEMGAAGVLILGCGPGVCHYEQGNERCAAAFEQASGLARLLALDDRLKLEWISPDDGAKFARVVTDFVGELR